MSTLQVWHEALFQEGMNEHAGLVGDHEIWDGRRLLDTTPEERVAKASAWVAETQRTRLRHMLLGEPAGPAVGEP